MNGAKDDGRAFVLIKPVCQDSGDGSCQAWKDGGNDEWLFVTLRYKYQTVFVTPKVEAVESIEDTGGLSSDASAVIASPRLLFILDGGSLLNVTFGDRHGRVTSVVSVPPMFPSSYPPAGPFQFAARPLFGDFLYHGPSVFYIAQGGIVYVPMKTGKPERNDVTFVPGGTYYRQWGTTMSFNLANRTTCGRECQVVADLWSIDAEGIFRIRNEAHSVANGGSCDNVPCFLADPSSLSLSAFPSMEGYYYVVRPGTDPQTSMSVACYQIGKNSPTSTITVSTASSAKWLIRDWVDAGQMP